MSLMSNDSYEWRKYSSRAFADVVFPRYISSEKMLDIIKAVCRYCISVCERQDWFDGDSFDDLTVIVDNLGDAQYLPVFYSTIHRARSWVGGPMRVMYAVLLYTAKTTFDRIHNYEDVTRYSLAEIVTFLTTYCGVNYAEALASVNEIIAGGCAK